MKTKRRIAIVSLIMCMVVAICCAFLVKTHDTANAVGTAAVTGVQVRSGGDTNNFIVLQNDAYSAIAAGTTVSDAGKYNTRSKVKIYTSAEDTEGKYLTEICGTWWTQNLWSSGGLMMAYNTPSDYSTYNGKTIYKIVIEAGCQLPCGDTVYETAETFSYVNTEFGSDSAINGAFNWTRVASDLGTTSLTGVQVRSDGVNANFIVLLSDVYNTTPSGKADISSFNTRGKIKVYTSAADTTGKSLSELIGTWYEYEYWGQKGFLMAFNNPDDYKNTYNGSSIYKIVIEAGCQLPYGQYGYYTTAEDYTFRNTEFGSDSVINGAYNWTRVASDLGTTSLTGIQVRSGGDRREYLVLLSDDYTGTANAEDIYSSLVTLDKIKVYTSSNATPVALSEIFNGHIDQTVWTQPGLFINIKDYEDKYNGTTIYKVVIEKGCEFPIVEDGVTKILVTDVSYTFYNKEYGRESSKDGSYQWRNSVLESETAVLSGVQVRAATYSEGDNAGKAAEGDSYLVICSEQYDGVAQITDATIDTSLVTYDKIKIYTSSDGEPIVLADIFNGYLKQRLWEKGLFINIKDYESTYNGSSIYKVVIEKGFEFPIIKDGVTKILVTDKEYTYRNLRYGETEAKYGAYSWGIESTLTLKNGEATVGTLTVANGVAIGTLPVVPAKEGYTALGWYLGDGTKINAGDIWSYTEDTTAYAKYAQQIDITDKWTVQDYTSSANTFKTFQFSLNDSAVNFKYIGGNYWWNDNGETQKSNNCGVDITDYIYINGKSVKQLITENAAKDVDKQYGGIIGTNAGIYAPVTVYNWDNAIEIKILNAYIENEIDGDWSITFKEGFKLVNEDNQILKVTKDVVVYEWFAPQRTEFSISGVQVRAGLSDSGKADARRSYFVLLADSYNNTDARDNIDASFVTLDKIKIYTEKDGAPVALSAIFNGNADQSLWTQPGLFLNIKDYEDKYNGTTIYKVVIEKGCEFPIVEGGRTNILVADKDYTFYNKSYNAESAKYEAFNWGTTETPTEARNLGNIGVTTVTVQAEEKVAEGAERGRWIIIRMAEDFPIATAADDYLTYNLTNILDNVLIYSAMKGEDGEVTNLVIKPIKDYFKGGMTLRQFGSPADIGFSVSDLEAVSGTKVYAIKILKGCEIPYLTADEEYCVKTIAEDILFINNDWGFSGEIGGSDEGGVIRHYENWAQNWSGGCEFTFEVKGIEGVSFDPIFVKNGGSVELGSFAREGYEVSATDEDGTTYYDAIVYSGKGSSHITLTYTAKTDDSKNSEKSGCSCSGSIDGVFGLQAVILVASVVAITIKRKRSVK